MSSKNTPILKSPRIRVGITIGDPSGVGSEITAKALKKLKGLADFTVIGNEYAFGRSASSLSVNFINLNNIDAKKFSFGKISPEYGRASMGYLNKALELIKTDKIDCLVTCPISKEAINLAGFKWPGHTEYLAKQAKTKYFAMMLLNSRLKISLVTRHIPISCVSSQLSQDKICQNILLTHKALRDLFAIQSPRIAVCGLNPHASDNGLIGKEENLIIKPAIKKLEKIIRHIHGPLPADTAIFKALENDYDCAVAMYHDQALIPLKIMQENNGVNLTLGLPFIRTSPLHGTAFNIAGKNAASPSSLIAAIKLAIKCAQNQKKD